MFRLLVLTNSKEDYAFIRSVGWLNQKRNAKYFKYKYVHCSFENVSMLLW